MKKQNKNKNEKSQTTFQIVLCHWTETTLLNMIKYLIILTIFLVVIIKYFTSILATTFFKHLIITVKSLLNYKDNFTLPSTNINIWFSILY